MSRAVTAVALLLAAADGQSADAARPVMGLAYAPYVGHWSQAPDNPFAPDRFYTPSFSTYAGGLDLDDPARSLLAARQRIGLFFDPAGRLQRVAASGELELHPDALRDAGPERWSQTWFRHYDGPTARAAVQVDNQSSVYRQLDFLVRQAAGAPLELATYGTGLQVGYWRRLNDQEYAALPVWSDSRVDYQTGDAPPQRTRSIDEVFYYFPASAYARLVPERTTIETSGRAGQDLQLLATHQTIFTPARKGDPGARLNPGFFAGDANAQIALAAAELNARAGKRLLTLALGVDNLAVDGSLVNDRMRFSILSALAQAQLANGRFPGTVTHLVISNEYAVPQESQGGRATATEQVTQMVRFARSTIARGGDFAGLGLQIGARGNHFRRIDTRSSDPAIQRFTRDVGALVRESDFLMENIYPSQESVAAARRAGRWDGYFGDDGELDRQWSQLRDGIGAIAGGKRIALMIGEIGYPTNGINFNLPGSALARVADAIDLTAGRIRPAGIAVFQDYANPTLASDFLAGACDWSRRQGVQIHLFEAFDEPQKFVQNLPLPGLTLRDSLLAPAGGYGAEGFFGIFGYSGVAAFHPTTDPTAIAPGSRLRPELPDRLGWTGQFAGRFFGKRPAFDFAATAAAFESVISE